MHETRIVSAHCLHASEVWAIAEAQLWAASWRCVILDEFPQKKRNLRTMGFLILWCNISIVLLKSSSGFELIWNYVDCLVKFGYCSCELQFALFCENREMDVCAPARKHAEEVHIVTFSKFAEEKSFGDQKMVWIICRMDQNFMKSSSLPPSH